MEKNIRVHRTLLWGLGVILLGIALLGGCATTPKVESHQGPAVTPPRIEARVFSDFVAVIAQQGDTFGSLAAKYLNDASMDWVIAEYNALSALNPGQELIIPLKPYEKGGLTLKGYQTVPVLSYHTFSLDKSTNRMTITKAVF